MPNACPPVPGTFQDVEVARRLAISGYGIAPLNAYTVSVSQPPKALTVMANSMRPTIHETLYLVTRKRKWPNPLAEHLVKTFRIPPRHPQ